MSYEVFQLKVNALIARVGGGINVRFNNDTDKGRFFANCSDGTTIIGCPSTLKVTVRWGFDADRPANYSHQTMVAI